MDENAHPAPSGGITIKIQNFIDEEQLSRDVAYNPLDLTTAMMQQSSFFVEYGRLHAQAARQLDTIELYVKNLEATVYQQHRNKMTAAGEKFTESVLDKAVLRDSRVQNAMKALNDARHVERMTKMAVDGFRQRRDMLIQHGLIFREEMKGELVMKENSRGQAQGAREMELRKQREAFANELAEKAEGI